MLKDKTVLRNTIAVIVGLAVIYAIIQFGLIYNADRLGWDDKVFPEWRHIIKYFSHQEGKKFEVQFFGSMLAISGIAALVGGVITALIVRRAKQAYTMFVGYCANCCFRRRSYHALSPNLVRNCDLSSFILFIMDWRFNCRFNLQKIFQKIQTIQPIILN